MNKKVLSVEQMQHLKELGVDTSKASAYYYNNGLGNKICFNNFGVLENNEIPTFTLQDMLEMMPKELYLFKDKFILEIYPFLDSWYVRYKPDEKSGRVPYSFQGYKIIDAVYRCLRWLAKQGFLKGGKK